MDFANVTSLITTVGFPIVMCGVMAYYIKYTNDKQREERQIFNDKIVAALDNNTKALHELKCAVNERSVA